MTETDRDAVSGRLTDLILRVAPNATAVSKYGGTLYTLRPEEKEGQFCGVFPYAKHVQLSFAQGTKLDDPGGVLKGTGKFRRHVSFASAEEVDEATLTPLLTQAATEAF